MCIQVTKVRTVSVYSRRIGLLCKNLLICGHSSNSIHLQFKHRINTVSTAVLDGKFYVKLYVYKNVLTPFAHRRRHPAVTENEMTARKQRNIHLLWCLSTARPSPQRIITRNKLVLGDGSVTAAVSPPPLYCTKTNKDDPKKFEKANIFSALLFLFV